MNLVASLISPLSLPESLKGWPVRHGGGAGGGDGGGGSPLRPFVRTDERHCMSASGALVLLSPIFTTHTNHIPARCN